MLNKLRLATTTSFTIFLVLLFILTRTTTAAERPGPSTLRKMGAYFVSPEGSSCSAQTSPGATSSAGPIKDVYILGDSIAQRTTTAYRSAFTAKGITTTIDASSGRGINTAGTDGNTLSGLAAIEQEGKLPESAIKAAGAIVIALGSTGDLTPKNIADTISALRTYNPTAPVYWVDTVVINKPDYTPTIKAANTNIYDQSSLLGYKVISWYKTVVPNGDPKNPSTSDADTKGYIAQGDQNYHPSSKGIPVLSTLVAGSVAGSSNGSVTSASIGCCSAVVSSDTNLLGADNMQRAFNFFVQKGLTKEQAAGIVGNMMAESGVVPKKLQGVYDKETSSKDVDINTSLGWGIVQWTPASKIIQTSLDAGITYEQMDTLGYQLEALFDQLNGTGALGAVSNEKVAFEHLKTTTTVEDAAVSFAWKYERFKNSQDLNNPEYAKRKQNAIDILTTYGGSATGAGGNVVTSSSGSDCSSFTPAGQKTKFVDNFTVYSQYDPAWRERAYSTSTIGESGCGPSAMAMIITALTGQKVTPIETADYAASIGMYIAGSGSSWDISPKLAEHWALKSQKISANLAQISSTLQSGGLVIASGNGGVPFTTGGHYIVIRGLTSDGKFMVGDSNNAAANNTAFDVEQILSNMKEGSVYAITK